MNCKLIRQYTGSLLVVLSLFVSAIAACSCEHHQIQTKTDAPSCHQSSHEAEKADSHKKAAGQTNHEAELGLSCVCFTQSAPEFFGKIETLKIQKQAALVTAEIEIIYGLVPVRAPSVKRFEFSKVSFSDSSYNIKSPRGPPFFINQNS